MIRAKVSRISLVEHPELVWNGFIDVIALNEYDDLSPGQRPAHLAFWYDSEVNNGGHLQYFFNRGLREAERALAPLELLGASQQRAVLTEAIRAYRESGVEDRKPRTAEQHCDTALEGQFDDLDSQYYRCSPDITELLERYLQTHAEQFVEYI